jgi:DNA-formamidopyrimidine glycosylase/dephospho-CoA kinase
MPELPEVETVVRVLRHHLIGAIIDDVTVRHVPMFKGTITDFKKHFLHQSITDIGRLGKFILLHFEHGMTLVSHLRMEGKYKINDASVPPSRYAHVSFHLTDGRRIDYEDVRKFGTFEWIETRDLRRLKSLSALGIEPALVTDVASIHKAFHRSSRPIKSLLLDQTILLGLGNIYADETLFASKIHPLTRGCDLTYDATALMIQHAVIILNQAIEAGGTRIRSYSSGQAIDGQFVLNIRVYQQDGRPCQRCHHRIAKIVVAGRGTHYCPSCQHDPRFPYIIGVTGGMASGKSTLLRVADTMNIPTYRADSIIHDLYKKKTIQKTLQSLIDPHLFKHGILQRDRLLDVLVSHPKLRKKLEDFMHPLVLHALQKKIHKHRGVVVVEIPLLFQSGADAWIDTIIGISVPQAIQHVRIQARHPHQTEAYLALAETNDWASYRSMVQHILVNDQSLAKFETDCANVLQTIIKALPREHTRGVQTIQ